MRRRSTLLVLAGFLTTLAALVSYFTFFVRFPATRDFPWANLLLFAAGGGLLGLGLKRAFQPPGGVLGKAVGSVLGLFSALIFGLFLFYNFYLSSKLPGTEHAPRLGQKAPGFTLADQYNRPVTLATLLGDNAAAEKKGQWALLVFYRGYW